MADSPGGKTSDKPEGKRRNTSRKSENSVHLRFVGRTWDDVLESVAKDAGKTLVMPDVPAGRLSRYDHSAHTLEEALRILNHELDSTGYKIMTRGDYLIVLRDDRFRPEYSRQVIPRRETLEANGSTPPAGPPANPAYGVEHPGFGQVQQAEWRDADMTGRSVVPSSAERHAVTDLFPATGAVTPSPLNAAEANARMATIANTVQIENKSGSLEKAAKAARTAIAIEPEFVSAVELSRQIYQAYGKQARLIQQGPLGLPGIEVKLPGDEGKPARDFVIGINQAEDQLILVAAEKEQQALVQLLEELDIERKTTRTGVVPPAPRLMQAAPHVHETISEQLPRILAQVAQANNQPENGNGATLPPARPDSVLSQPPQPTAPADGTVPPAGTPGMGGAAGGELPADLNEILDRLRGDVSIESLNDLGLLILRGNETDVDGVMQIIQAIERMSAGTTPEIHLRHLEHVNSESLATLLNSIYESVQNIDRRASRANRRVSVTAVVQPNSVLIVAPSLELDSVLALIDELDQPLAPNTQVKIFRMKHTTAAGAVALLTEFYQDRGGLGTRVRVSADARSNTLVVQASPKDLEEIQTVLRNIDKDESHAISRLQLFPLKNAVADELAEFINTAMNEALNPRTTTQTGFQQQQQSNLNQAKSFVLEFLSGSGSQAELIRSGLLADIRVSADSRTNSLAVIAPERSMPLFSALIEALDKPSNAVAEVKVFTLTHADANAAMTLLQELFDQTTGTSAPVGMNLAGTSDAGSSLLPVRFSVDTRSNSILAIGGADALTVVEAILLRLDNEAPKKRINTVLLLNNRPAVDVADAINQFLTSQRELSQIDPNLISAFEQVDREVIVVPEILSNKLLISATPEYYSEVVRIAKELDAAPAQVIIQALLVEVQLDNLDELGVELGFQDSVLFNRSIIDNIQTVTNTVTNQNIQTTTQQIVSQEGSPGFLFNGPLLGNNTGPASNPSSVGGQGLSNFGVGRVSGDLGYGGLVLSASSESVSVLVRALAQQRNVQVLSRPQIRTVDGEQAQIQVGQRVPIVNGVTLSNTGLANPNIEYDEAGIILSVRPRINPDGQIVMEVVAERSAYREGGVPVFVDGTTGNTINAPVKDISVATATVGVTDGQTIVLGGMISETDSAVTRKVPWLGDIPVLGRLFRYDSATNVRSELLIFLTPRILHNECDNEMIKEIEAGRIHFFREEAEEIHGPLFGVPMAEEFLLPGAMVPMDHKLMLESPVDLAPSPLLYEPNPDSGRVPLSPPAMPGDGTIPRTIVPDDSLKQMSYETDEINRTSKATKAPARPKGGVRRIFSGSGS